MHAYLVVGNKTSIDEKVSALVSKLKSKLLTFEAGGIEDIRNITKFSSISLPDPTAILINNINELTPEGTSAFLKNLEEPRENLFYILSAPSTNGILPTLVSRCQIIKGSAKNELDFSSSEAFLKMKVGERLKFTGSLKTKAQAIEFLENIIRFFKSRLLESSNYDSLLIQIEAAENSYQNIRKNGQVGLQLTNFIANLEN